MGLDYFSEIVQ